MTLYEAINARRSVRKYQSVPVEQEKLDRILEAVRLAPSACNLQPWRFVILKSREKRVRMKGILQDWALEAPLIIVALGNRRTAWQRDGESIHQVDVAIAFEHLTLAAAAEGLGTCWICAFDRQAVVQTFGLGPEWEPVAVTPLGYADESRPRTPRKHIGEIVQVV